MPSARWPSVWLSGRCGVCQMPYSNKRTPRENTYAVLIGKYLCTATCYAAQTRAILIVFVWPFHSYNLYKCKMLKLWPQKRPDGVFIKFPQILNPLKTDTTRKPTSKGVEWCQFELHSWFQCRESCGQVRAGMYSNKRTPRVSARAFICSIDRLISLHCNMLCSSNKGHSNRLCMTFSLIWLIQNKNVEAKAIKTPWL